MSFKLRTYQATALTEIQNVYRAGFRRALLVAPTGAGKSAMVGDMISKTRKRTLILVHRAELLDMVSESLPMRHGVIQPGKALPADPVAVGMMQTVSRRLGVLPNYEWIISDEAHLAMCPTWESILNHYDKAWHLGMSATPCRLDGKGLGLQYEKIVQCPSIGQLTTMGFLTPCRVFAPPADVPREIVEAKGTGDNLNKQAALMDTPAITGDAIDHYRRIASGRQAIVFVTNCQHGENVAAQFTMAGFPATFVDGSMHKDERKRRISAYRARQYLILITVDLLTTGFDCPQIEVGIFLRRTDSLALFLQMVGRFLRIYPGKRDAIMLDHCGNVFRHGLPSADRQWSLDGSLVRQAAPKIKQCPECFYVHEPSPRCPSCHYVYVSAPAARKEMKVGAGTLHEIKEAQIASAKAVPLKDAIRACQTYEDLQRLAKQRGYHHGWVQRQLMFHRRLRPQQDIAA